MLSVVTRVKQSKHMFRTTRGFRNPVIAGYQTIRMIFGEETATVIIMLTPKIYADLALDGPTLVTLP